jgi:hypothetical protein
MGSKASARGVRLGLRPALTSPAGRVNEGLLERITRLTASHATRWEIDDDAEEEAHDHRRGGGTAT